MFRQAAAVYLVLAVVALVWIGWREGSITLELFVAFGGWWVDVAAGLAAAVLMLGAWEVVRRRSRRARALEESLRRLIGPLDRTEIPALAVLSGLSEELLFRGAIQPSWGFLLATGLFGVLHTGRGAEYRLWTLAALAAGGVLGGLMWWRGSLLAPIVAHTVLNAVNLHRLRASGSR